MNSAFRQGLGGQRRSENYIHLEVLQNRLYIMRVPRVNPLIAECDRGDTKRLNYFDVRKPAFKF